MEEKRKKELLSLARRSLEASFEGPEAEVKETEERYGAFVTLRKHGELRGCIGYMEPVDYLERQIRTLVREAAFEDPRFESLRWEETGELDIEISLLTPMKEIQSLDDFVPSRDGIMLTLYGRRAVFLPQVADETGWGKEEMLSALSMKAGLPRNAWKNPEAEFSTFQAEVFSEGRP